MLSIKDANGNDITYYDSFAIINPIRYRGYFYDTESGLYYLQSRYYDPAVGRCISPDSVDYLGASGAVSSYNLFAYCENDAIQKRDSTGCIAIADDLTVFGILVLSAIAILTVSLFVSSSQFEQAWSFFSRI